MSDRRRASRSNNGQYPNQQQSQHLPAGSVRLPSRSPYVNNLSTNQLLSTPSTHRDPVNTSRSDGISIPGNVPHNASTSSNNSRRSSLQSTSSSARVSRRDLGSHIEQQQENIRTSSTNRLTNDKHVDKNIDKRDRNPQLPQPSNSSVRLSDNQLMAAEEGGRSSQNSLKSNNKHFQEVKKPVNPKVENDDLLLLSSTNMMSYQKGMSIGNNMNNNIKNKNVIREEDEDDGDSDDYTDDDSNGSNDSDSEYYSSDEGDSDYGSETDDIMTPIEKNNPFNSNQQNQINYPVQEVRSSAKRLQNVPIPQNNLQNYDNFNPKQNNPIHSSKSQSKSSNQLEPSRIKSINRSTVSSSVTTIPSSTSFSSTSLNPSTPTPTRPLPVIESPFVQETFQQLTDINTVPREVYLDYLSELRRPGTNFPGSNSGTQSDNPDSGLAVPKEVEHWTVKLPTRLEFKNITIRVMKKFPVNQPAVQADPAVANRKAQLPPGANPNPLHHPDAKKANTGGKSTKNNQRGKKNQKYQSPSSTQSVDAGFEYDLEDDDGDGINGGFGGNNNSFDPNNDNNFSDGDSSDELFSPSSFKRNQQLTRQKNRQYSAKNSTQNQRKKSLSVHSLPDSHNHRGSSTSIHSSTLGYNIPKPNQLFDDSDDEEAFENPNKKGCFGSKQEFETRSVTILDNLSGYIEPGSMVAIMGGSGAGKTTLLNALSGRVPLVDPSTPDGAAHLRDQSKPINAGSVCFNSTRVTESELASMTGYVMQNDVFLGTLTPRETLQFAAKLQLPPAISESRRLKRVERVIQQLDLQHIADSPIGGMFSKGISGGQKRRVSVGIELIKDPSVIFLDEPTSGLDSTTAVNVMRVLKHLAQTGRTVIFTIHSPNSKILELFDTMILLSRGRLAYFGPAKQTAPYFASLGYDCPLFSNPAEFFLNVLTPNTVAMFHTMLHNTHHSPEDMLTPMDPRWKSIVLLRSQQGYHGYQSSSPIPLLTGPGDGDNDKRHDKKNTKTNLSSMSLQNGPIQDWIRLYLGYGDSTVIQDDNWAVYINGVKQETLRQKRRRHLIASQHDQYALLHDYRSMNETDPDRVHEYRTSTQLNGSKIWNYALFPQSTHIYQQLFYPDEDSGSTYPPPPNPSYLSTVQYQALELHSNGQLFDIDEVLIERENKRLALITDTYLKYPIQPNHSLSPFLSNYIPKLRVLDKEGAVALQEIGFDFQIKGLGGGKKSKTAPDKEARRKIDIVQPGKAALPWVDQLKVLTHRTFLHTVRDPLNTVARIGVNLLLSFFVGLLFFQTGDSQKSLYARVGFLFFMTSIQAFITVMGAVLTFSEERALFIREYHKQIYATSSYFLGRTIIDVIMQTVLSVLFGSLAYPMVGLRPSFMTFVKYTICLIMVAQGTHSYALVLGAIIPYRTVALMLSPVVMVPFLTVSGFLAPLNQLSPAISWLTWFSPQRWMFEAMMNLELIDLAFQCRPAEFITVPLDNGTMEKVCPILTGKAVLSLFGLSANPNTFIINVIACVIIAVVIKVVALGALKFSAWWTIRNSTGA